MALPYKSFGRCCENGRCLLFLSSCINVRYPSGSMTSSLLLLSFGLFNFWHRMGVCRTPFSKYMAYFLNVRSLPLPFLFIVPMLCALFHGTECEEHGRFLVQSFNLTRFKKFLRYSSSNLVRVIGNSWNHSMEKYYFIWINILQHTGRLYWGSPLQLLLP